MIGLWSKVQQSALDWHPEAPLATQHFAAAPNAGQTVPPQQSPFVVHALPMSEQASGAAESAIPVIVDRDGDAGKRQAQDCRVHGRAARKLNALPRRVAQIAEHE